MIEESVVAHISPDGAGTVTTGQTTEAMPPHAAALPACTCTVWAAAGASPAMVCDDSPSATSQVVPLSDDTWYFVAPATSAHDNDAPASEVAHARPVGAPRGAASVLHVTLISSPHPVLSSAAAPARTLNA